MKQLNLLVVLAAVLITTACNKDWLNVKSDKSLVVPTTIKDLQALLDYNDLMNFASTHGLQDFAEIGSDNFFLQDATWQSLSGISLPYKNTYCFEKEIFENYDYAWAFSYQRIFYANVALDGLNKFAPAREELAQYNQAKGSALFIRAHSFFWLSQLFTSPYNGATAATDKGLALRLSSDINEPSVRASVQDTYSCMLRDLKEAIPLLPATAPYKTRPTQPAGLALIARIYLSMQQYDSAHRYADACLKVFSELMDFNEIITTPTYPIPRYNMEVIYSDQIATTLLNPAYCRVDTTLYASYANHDLRRTVFFKPRAGTTWYTFNGSYEGSARVFGGIATNEVYLMRAECLARTGETEAAMADLNTLMEKRWDNTNFIKATAASSPDALQQILIQRRKELCFRGLRWMDLRRLNVEGANITVTRLLAGTTYQLLPNDKRYTLPIPSNVIELTGMEQNIR